MCASVSFPVTSVILQCDVVLSHPEPQKPMHSPVNSLANTVKLFLCVQPIVPVSTAQSKNFQLTVK